MENKYYSIHAYGETKIQIIIVNRNTKKIVILTDLPKVRGCVRISSESRPCASDLVSSLLLTLPALFSAICLVFHIPPAMHLHFDRAFWK